MIVKIVSFFLIGIVILGMFGKLRLPKKPTLPKRTKAKKNKNITDARKCDECGSYILGDGPCPCKTDPNDVT